MKWHFVVPFLLFLSSASSENVNVEKKNNAAISIWGREKRETTSSKHNGMWSSIEDFHKLTEPKFDNSTTTNVTAQMGSVAFLYCKVRNLGERTISWIRRRDWHILTSGLFTYTNDERFQMLHAEGSEDWTLQIKYVQERDNGTYECQVSTGQGVLSHFVNLEIVTPEAFILGGPGDYHVDIGSPINLMCVIEKCTEAPKYVLWYHNTKMINYDTSRGGITVETEQIPRPRSKLTIRDATEMDSGNYSCVAPNTLSASILVFVSEGDKMAAFSRRKSLTGSAAELIVNVMLWFVLLPFVTINIR